MVEPNGPDARDEARLDELLAAMLGEGDRPTGQDWLLLREQLRLYLLYPDRYVVYRNHNLDGGDGPPPRREVLYSSPDLAAAQGFLGGLRPEELEGVEFDYIETDSPSAEE